jgi:hypothetical protein
MEWRKEGWQSNGKVFLGKKNHAGIFKRRSKFDTGWKKESQPRWPCCHCRVDWNGRDEDEDKLDGRIFLKWKKVGRRTNRWEKSLFSSNWTVSMGNQRPDKTWKRSNIEKIKRTTAKVEKFQSIQSHGTEGSGQKYPNYSKTYFLSHSRSEAELQIKIFFINFWLP